MGDLDLIFGITAVEKLKIHGGVTSFCLIFSDVNIYLLLYTRILSSLVIKKLGKQRFKSSSRKHAYIILIPLNPTFIQ